MLFIALKCHFLHKLTHTAQQTLKHLPHCTTPDREGRTHTRTGTLGYLSLGPLPCYVSKMQNSQTPTKCFRIGYLVFVLLFGRARADHKQEWIAIQSSAGACQQRPRTHISACFVLYNTCKSFAKELKNPSLNSKQP